MSDSSWPYLNPEDLVPSLRAALEASSPPDLRTTRLQVTVQVKEPKPGEPIRPEGRDRHHLAISAGEAPWDWHVESLQSLFRGQRQPPDLGDYPQAYQGCFAMIESHLVLLCDALGDRRDQEMEEIYSALRRRPDGRSLGFAHDFLWQVSAWLLGTHPLSQAEFEAIIGRLERSCRRFAMGPSSRNYIATLKKMF